MTWECFWEKARGMGGLQDSSRSEEIEVDNDEDVAFDAAALLDLNAASQEQNWPGGGTPKKDLEGAERKPVDATS